MIITNEMIADFIQSNYEPSLNWPRKNLLAWIDWFRRDGRCAVIASRGAIKGVALGRLLADRQNSSDHYATSPRARTVFVDLVIGSRRLTRAMFVMMRRRFPTVRKIRFARVKRDGKDRTYNLERIERKMNHGRR